MRLFGMEVVSSGAVPPGQVIIMNKEAMDRLRRELFISDLDVDVVVNTEPLLKDWKFLGRFTDVRFMSSFGVMEAGGGTLYYRETPDLVWARDWWHYGRETGWWEER